jgi:SAM-dependent methyltransferase
LSPAKTLSETEEERISAIQQRWIVKRARGRALQIGCGMKPILGVINSDPNPERWPWADVACDAHALPFADGSLDSVVSNHVVPHLHNPVLALREMARVLRPGGVIAHVIPDLRYAPRRHSKRHPFADQPHGWWGPLDFWYNVMSKLGHLFSVVKLADFEEFRFSFRLEAVRL